MSFVEKVLQFLRRLGLKWFDYKSTPYDDYAHAGEFKGSTLTHLQIMTLRLQTIVGAALDRILTDTSRWQLEINYAQMVSAGIRGTILKAGQGLGLDPYFKKNYAKAKSANLKRGTYWYYDSRVHPKTQAKLWADALEEVGYGELPHFADYEENYGGPYRGVGNFIEFVQEFQRLTGLPSSKIGIYTGYYYWIAHGLNDILFRQYWLWLAWYGPMENVIIPKPWGPDQLLIWQFTDKGDGPLAGVSSLNVDLNYFVKGLEAFEQMYGDVAELPTGETMETGNFKLWSDTYNMSLRKAPSINGDWVLTVPRTTVMMADQIVPPSSGGLAGDKWARVTEVNGVPPRDANGNLVVAWVAIIHNGVVYCKYENLPVDERPNPTMKIEFTDRDGKVWFIEGEMSERA